MCARHTTFDIEHDFVIVRNAVPLQALSPMRGRTTPQGSADFLRRLARLPIRVPPSPDDDALMTLARERKLTVYDAAYLELAKREALPLATLDRDLEKAAIAEGVVLFEA
jgi:predicted nucleic acid-binding protein